MNAFATPEMQALRERLAQPKRTAAMETEATSPPGNVERRHDPKRAKTPHTIHLREWNMPDGRKLLVDRRAVAFICEGKPEEVPGKVTTIVAFRTLTKACPVLAPYDAVKAWWLGTPPRS